MECHTSLIPRGYFPPVSLGFYTQEEIRRDQGKGNYGKIVDERLRTVSGGFIPIYTDVSKKLEDGSTTFAFVVPDFNINI